MPNTYEDASNDIMVLTEELIEQHYLKLSKSGAVVGVIMVYGPEDEEGNVQSSPLKELGTFTPAKARVINTKDRLRNSWDVEILIDGDYFDEVGDETKKSIIDDILSRIELQYDKKGIMKVDEFDRPRIRIKPPEIVFTANVDTISRYGNNSHAIKTYKKIMESYGYIIQPDKRQSQTDEVTSE
jgi:hypothetical protein